jgi:release factor glutamine methyltransferase
MRLLDLLETSTVYLAKNQVESPRLTMELILAHVLQKSRMQLYMEFDSDIPEPTLQKLRPLVKQRGEGIPLEHLIGEKEFDGQRFKITPDVLIPRPETELLLEAIVPLVDTGTIDLPLVDVGAGSGILAVSLARRFPALQVVGIDRSEKALAIATENGAGLKNLTFQQGDLLSGWTGKAQLIVANLPYIPSSDISRLSREVQREPTMALDGGPDGLDLIRRLITESTGRTRWLALEIGDRQAEAVKGSLINHGYEATQVVLDFKKMERIVIGKSNG